MFVKNTFEYDARVTREASSLVKAGHQVTVVALHDPRATAEQERTAAGIDVVRVPRSDLGVPTINRLVGRYVRTVESRRSRLTGEPIDRSRVHERGRLTNPSTVAPQSEPLLPLSSRDAQTEATPWKRAWGLVTSAILRSSVEAARWMFNAVRRMLGDRTARLKTRAIDRRMVKAGLAVDADVYHAHDLNTLTVAVRCKARTPGARLVYDSHELQTERSRMSPDERRAAVLEEGAGLSHADAFIVASPSWIPWNRELYGSVPPHSVSLLNVPDYQNVEQTDLLHVELDLPSAARIVLYQGSIQENRGIEPAIEAVRLLEGVVLVVIGYGYHRPTLEAYVAREGLGERVRFFGPIPNNELLAYTAAADVGLCNIVNSSVSYYTSLPNKLFEYVMARVPIVGSDSPEIGRVVSEESIGEVCDPVDPAALANAIETILAEPERYEPGLDRAAAHYNWEVEQDKLIALYDQLP